MLSSPEPGAAAGLLLSQFPLRPITNKALEGKENPKTIGFKRKSPKRRLWRMKRGGFEEVSRFSRRASGWKPADTTVCAFAHFSSWWEKWAAGGTVPTKEKHPSERKRKPAKRERIPTTSLRTGLGMTGLAYERIFSSPIKSALPCTVSLRGNRRSAACGG